MPPKQPRFLCTFEWWIAFPPSALIIKFPFNFFVSHFLSKLSRFLYMVFLSGVAFNLFSKSSALINTRPYSLQIPLLNHTSLDKVQWKCWTVWNKSSLTWTLPVNIFNSCQWQYLDMICFWNWICYKILLTGPSLLKTIHHM